MRYERIQAQGLYVCIWTKLYRRLCLFRHVGHVNLVLDHQLIPLCHTNIPLQDGKRWRGPLAPTNIGLFSALHLTQDHNVWYGLCSAPVWGLFMNYGGTHKLCKLKIHFRTLPLMPNVYFLVFNSNLLIRGRTGGVVIERHSQTRCWKRLWVTFVETTDTVTVGYN